MGYCQGMSDLVAPLLTEIQDESDTFWCFVGLMENTIFISSPRDEDMERQLVGCFYVEQKLSGYTGIMLPKQINMEAPTMLHQKYLLDGRIASDLPFLQTFPLTDYKNLQNRRWTIWPVFKWDRINILLPFR